MKIPMLFALVSISAGWGAQPRKAGGPERANVKIVVTTTFGEPVGKHMAVLKAIGPTDEYRQSGDAVSFRDIPFGLYDLEIQAAGFRTRRERVGVYQAEVSLWFGLVLSTVSPTERPEIIGAISPPPKASEKLWVRAVALYSGDFVEDKVTRQGAFHLGGVHPGRYALLIFNSERFLAARPIECNGGKLSITLDVPR